MRYRTLLERIALPATQRREHGASRASGGQASRPACPTPSPPGVMDGYGAGGLSGLIDEVRADRRRLTRGGGRRAQAGGRAQTRRRSRSAPGRRQRPTGAPPGPARGRWRPSLAPRSPAALPFRPSAPWPPFGTLCSAAPGQGCLRAWNA